MTTTIDTSKKSASAQFVLKKVRLMFPNLQTTRVNTLNGKNEYTAAIVIPEGSVHAEKFPEKIDELTKNFFIEKELKSKNFRNFLKRPEDQDDVEESRAMWGNDALFFFNTKASEDQPPILVDAAKQPLKDMSMLSNGALVNIMLNLYLYRMKTGNGITSYIKAVQVLEGGSRTVNVDSVFDDESDDYGSSSEISTDSDKDSEVSEAVADVESFISD